MDNRYKAQKHFFELAYQTGTNIWPDVLPSPAYKSYIKHITSHICDYTALDIGCGKGRHVKMFAEKTPNIVVGVDYVLSCLKDGVSTNQLGLYNNVRLVNMDFFTLGLKTKFDVIIDSGMFHHVRAKDWTGYIKKVLSFLKDKAEPSFYILTVFSKNYTFYTERKLKRNWSIHNGRYDHYFSSEEVKDIFSKHFRIISSEVEKICEEKELLHFLMERI